MLLFFVLLVSVLTFKLFSAQLSSILFLSIPLLLSPTSPLTPNQPLWSIFALFLTSPHLRMSKNVYFPSFFCVVVCLAPSCHLIEYLLYLVFKEWCVCLSLNHTPDFHLTAAVSLLIPIPASLLYLLWPLSSSIFPVSPPSLFSSSIASPTLHLSPCLPCPLLISLVCMCVCLLLSLLPPCLPAVPQVRLLYCSQEEAELVFRAAWAAGQAGASHMWFAVGPALSGLGTESLPRALFAVRPQGWRDEPRRRIARGVSVLTHGAVAMRKDYGTTGGPNFVTNCMTDANQTEKLRGRMRWAGDNVKEDSSTGRMWGGKEDNLIVVG